MPRLAMRWMQGVLFLVTVGMTVNVTGAQDDTKKATDPKKPPQWKGYQPGPVVVAELKSASESELTFIVANQQYSLSGGRSRRSPPRLTVKEKREEFSVPMHEDGLVRWAKVPPKFDAKGRRITYLTKDIEALKQPRWALGFAAKPDDLQPGHVVEITLLVPKDVPAAELTPGELRIKQVLILSEPGLIPPTEGPKKKGPEKKDKK